MRISPHMCSPASKSSAPYISETLALSSSESAEYEAVVEDVYGRPLHNTGWREARMPSYGVYANWLRIIIDRFGHIWLDMMTGREDDPFHDQVELLETPPWQTSAQHAALQRMWKIQREYEESNLARLHKNITRNPYGWGKDVG